MNMSESNSSETIAFRRPIGRGRGNINHVTIEMPSRTDQEPTFSGFGNVISRNSIGNQQIDSNQFASNSIGDRVELSPSAARNRSVLDSSDKRLQTSCTKQGIEFLWPSPNETSEQETGRRERMRRLLLQKRNDARPSNARRNLLSEFANPDPQPRECNQNSGTNVTNINQMTSSQSTRNNIQERVPVQLETVNDTQPAIINFNNVTQRRRNRMNFPARQAEMILRGQMIVQEHSCGARLTEQGVPTNQCRYCSALLWPGETTGMCCNNGKTQLELFPVPPQYIQDLWQRNSDDARLFRQYARVFNNALAIASQKVTEVRPPGGGWAPSVVIQGKVHQYVGSITADTGQTPMLVLLIDVLNPLYK